MPLARSLNHSAPTLGDQFSFNTLGLQAITKPASHARHREPNLKVIELQQRLQLRQPKPVLLHLSLSPSTDDSMKMCLHLEQNADGNAPLQVWGEDTEQM